MNRRKSCQAILMNKNESKSIEKKWYCQANLLRSEAILISSLAKKKSLIK